MDQKHRFKFEKLIRDKLPLLLKEKKVDVVCRSLTKENYVVELKRKLLEESEEVFFATDRQETIEELADVLEVVQALAKAYDVFFGDIEQARLKKLKKRGGFEERTYCQYVEMIPSEKNKDSYEYFLSQPDRYPEETA